MARTTIKDLAHALEQMQLQLEAFATRVERLEADVLKPIPTDGPPAPAFETKPLLPEPAKPEIAEEEMIVISAALGAYLGERVRIKQIRLLSSRVWAQQGRVSIQASHNLHN